MANEPTPQDPRLLSLVNRLFAATVGKTFGTDEEAVRQILSSIPPEEFPNFRELWKREMTLKGYGDSPTQRNLDLAILGEADSPAERDEFQQLLSGRLYDESARETTTPSDPAEQRSETTATQPETTATQPEAPELAKLQAILDAQGVPPEQQAQIMEREHSRLGAVDGLAPGEILEVPGKGPTETTSQQVNFDKSGNPVSQTTTTETPNRGIPSSTGMPDTYLKNQDGTIIETNQFGRPMGGMEAQMTRARFRDVWDAVDSGELDKTLFDYRNNKSPEELARISADPNFSQGQRSSAAISRIMEGYGAAPSRQDRLDRGIAESQARGLNPSQTADLAQAGATSYEDAVGDVAYVHNKIGGAEGRSFDVPYGDGEVGTVSFGKRTPDQPVSAFEAPDGTFESEYRDPATGEWTRLTGFDSLEAAKSAARSKYTKPMVTQPESGVEINTASESMGRDRSSLFTDPAPGQTRVTNEASNDITPQSGLFDIVPEVPVENTTPITRKKKPPREGEERYIASTNPVKKRVRQMQFGTAPWIA